MKDLHSSIKAMRLFSPQSSGDDTAIVSEIIDRAGFDALELIIQTGSIGDANATFVVLVEDGEVSNLSDNAAVADAQLLGTELGAGFQYDDDNEVRKIGYSGNKRYVRVTITPTGNSTTLPAYISGVAILGSPRVLPQSTQAT